MTDLSTDPEVWPEGTIVVVTATDGDYRAGDYAIVEFYVSAEESADGEPFYGLAREDGTTYGMVPTQHLRLEMTAEQARARELPTALDLLREFDFFHGGLISATEDDEAEEAVYLYGETDDGLPFSARVRVDRIERAP